LAKGSNPDAAAAPSETRPFNDIKFSLPAALLVFGKGRTALLTLNQMSD
jgi:hypothetical protein